MLKMTVGQKRILRWFVGMLLLAMLWTFTSNHVFLYDMHTFLYLGIILAWGFMVHQRIANRQIRSHLVAASVFMFILFLSRLVRWRCLKYSAIALEYSWYAYYLSFVAVPLCAFLAAKCVGKDEKERPLRYVKWLWLIQAGFSVLAFSNPWHELFFHFLDKGADNYTYGPVWYACVGWSAALSVATIVIIIRRCKIPSAKRYWFIPVIGVGIGAAGILAYYICGGSPRLFGHQLFQLQEVFCLTFILPFESMIQLGILPNNSRYELFFENSPIPVALLDREGNVVYASKQPLMTGAEGKEGSPVGAEGEEGSPVGGVTRRRNEKEIHGGTAVWEEDLTAVTRLGEEIRKVTAQLEEENELIQRENEIRAERISYETKNRLYDKIAGAVREKALRIDGLITELEGEAPNERGAEPDADGKAKLIRAMVLGAYVKRMGNMMLLTEEAGPLSSRELGNAVRESMEYFGLTGILHDFQEKGERELPAGLILHSYELFEEILESDSEIYSLLAVIDARDGFLFRIAFDSETCPVTADWKKEGFAAAGAGLKVEQVDDIWRVTVERREVK